jgi:hypothetical protein
MDEETKNNFITLFFINYLLGAFKISELVVGLLLKYKLILNNYCLRY